MLQGRPSGVCSVSSVAPPVSLAGRALQKLFAVRAPLLQSTPDKFAHPRTAKVPGIGLSVELVSKDIFQIRKSSSSEDMPDSICQALRVIVRKFYGTVTRDSGPSLAVRFRLDDYAEVLSVLHAAPFEKCKLDLPPTWITTKILKERNAKMKADVSARDALQKYMGELPEQLRTEHPILPFQLEGISFGLSCKGRCLLADDMGLGKTLQALTIMAHYQDDWPVLIVTPATMRFVWKDQAFQWMPHILRRSSDVQVIMNDTQSIDRKAQMVIISYDMLARHSKFQSVSARKEFQSVIVDECQYIKSSSAKRTKAVLQVCKRAKRAVLISGTPLLNRAEELHSQLLAICPEIEKEMPYSEYCSRYCTGAGHQLELNSFLVSTLMVRRLKADVLHQLPQKIRRKIILEPLHTDVDKIGDVRKLVSFEFGSGDGALGDEVKTPSVLNIVKQTLKATAEAKLQCVAQYVHHVLSVKDKILLFAHHHVMLDSLEEHLKSWNLEYIRIDGKTPQDSRSDMVSSFQARSSTRVALLSITACGQGLTLTAADTVIFAEMYWVPAQLLQAEDRAHRLGQKNHVDVHYCIAEGTLDEHIFQLLNSKHRETSAVLDGMEWSQAQPTESPLDSVPETPTQTVTGDSARRDSASVGAPRAASVNQICMETPRTPTLVSFATRSHESWKKRAADHVGGGPFGARRKQQKILHVTM